MNTSNLVDQKAVAAHVLRHLAQAQSRGRLVDLDELAQAIGVPRECAREVVTSLHREGHVDAERMRLTMTGLGLAAAMRECKLRSPYIDDPPSEIHVAWRLETLDRFAAEAKAHESLAGVTAPA